MNLKRSHLRTACRSVRATSVIGSSLRRVTGPAGLCALLVFAAGCSISAESTCRDWQKSGAMVSTLSACTRCYDQFGENLDAVRGCAVGVDAATLIGGAARR